jgi:hypothetical protein
MLMHVIITMFLALARRSMELNHKTKIAFGHGVAKLGEKALLQVVTIPQEKYYVPVELRYPVGDG